MTSNVEDPVKRPTYRREVHYWKSALTEPPCGTLEERFDWSDEIEDVTCDACKEALARASTSAWRTFDDAAPDDQPGA